MNIFKRLIALGSEKKITEPQKPRSEKEIHPTVNLDFIEFLMTEEVISQNVTVEELHSLIAATEQSLRKTFTKIPFDFDLRTRFTVYIDKPVGIDLGLQVPIEGTNLSETLQQAANELNNLKEMKITAREHAVIVCAYFKVNKTD